LISKTIRLTTNRLKRSTTTNNSLACFKDLLYEEKNQVGNLSDDICKSVIEHAGKAFTWLNREIEKR
jgi:hypothetical protein